MPVFSDSSKQTSKLASLFQEYLTNEHKTDLDRLVKTKNEDHSNLVVDFNLLCEFTSTFSEPLLFRPAHTISLLDKALCQTVDNSTGTQPRNLHVRFTGLPVISEIHRDTIPSANDIGKFLALRATVSRVGPIQVIQSQATFRCTDCGFHFEVKAEFESHFTLTPPRRCSNCKQHKYGAIQQVDASSTNFSGKNFQEIIVHESYRCLSVGVVPKSICVYLEDDLLECVKPGDDVIINGVVLCRNKSPSLRIDAPLSLALYFRANYVENLSELRVGSTRTQPGKDRARRFDAYWQSPVSSPYTALDLRNHLVSSICPDVHGMFLVKLSLALLLAGAPEWNSSSTYDPTSQLSLRTRGNPHALLIGDPGTAKSVLLRSAVDLSHRAVLTTALGSSAAGLTASAVRDKGGGWSLEAGALVLADGGLCAIDEFASLHGTHRAAVHEAMEQQTISLAKAGLLTRLNCRCSVLAAANPPYSSSSHFDHDVLSNLPTPLLSRFDLIWRIVDPSRPTEDATNEDGQNWDRQVANFVLGLTESVNTNESHQTKLQPSVSSFKWTPDRLREYFAWVRHQIIKPHLSRGAASLLQRYYVWRRNQLLGDDCREDFDDYGRESNTGPSSMATARTTLRLLESMVRLTKAHARLMARSEARLEDAIEVINLMDASLVSTLPPYITAWSSSVTDQTSPEAVVISTRPLNASASHSRTRHRLIELLGPIEDGDDDDGQDREDRQLITPKESMTPFTLASHCDGDPNQAAACHRQQLMEPVDPESIDSILSSIESYSPNKNKRSQQLGHPDQDTTIGWGFAQSLVTHSTKDQTDDRAPVEFNWPAPCPPRQQSSNDCQGDAFNSNTNDDQARLSGLPLCSSTQSTMGNVAGRGIKRVFQFSSSSSSSAIAKRKSPDADVDYFRQPAVLKSNKLSITNSIHVTDGDDVSESEESTRQSASQNRPSLNLPPPKRLCDVDLASEDFEVDL